MGLFGFLKLGKKKEGAISTLAAAAAQEEPEFLKGLEVAAEKEVERKLEGSKEPAESVREEVEPELALWLSNGTTVKSFKELAVALKKMKAADYKEHVNDERNEIAEWVQEVLNDEALARQLRAANGRIQSARYVEKEIMAIKAARRKTGNASKPATAIRAARRIPYQPSATVAKVTKVKAAKAAAKEKTGKSELHPEAAERREIAEQSMQLTLPGAAESIREEVEIGKEDVGERKPRSWLFFFKKKGEREKEEAGKLGGEIEQALEVPEFPELPKIEDVIEDAEAAKMAPQIPEHELTEKPIEAAKEVKPSRGFLFFGRKGKKEERQEAIQEAEQKELSELMPELPVPEETGQEEREDGEKTAAAFEPEPHHAEWAETAEGIKEAMEAEAAERVRKGQEPLAEKQDRKESKTYEEAELEKTDRELESQEKGLSKEEEELNNKRLELTRRRYELIKQKGEVEKKKFDVFMKKHKTVSQSEEAMAAEHSTGFRTGFAAPATVYRGLPNFRLSGAYGKERLQALLEEAKQHISQNNVEEARKTLEEAQSAFGTAYMPLNEKKQMEYEILEVEADLKLASLK